ncbi:hypothetical protein GCM10012285_44980 [Streptomyces kronopolitis]|uniref:Uncharacterized protein n=1 Tax=Streptomyces kronopolitis TaxID=1612435 RepID=A0ABQ2JQC9_9ACTN|nr:hypothetical protein GCM10012285_44980 [Streptomyces kronopolitis]
MTNTSNTQPPNSRNTVPKAALKAISTSFGGWMRPAVARIILSLSRRCGGGVLLRAPTETYGPYGPLRSVAKTVGIGSGFHRSPRGPYGAPAGDPVRAPVRLAPE